MGRAHLSAAHVAPRATTPRQLIPRLPAGYRPAEVLTPREREVFVLLAEGLKAVTIAHRLGVSTRTVEKHLANGYAKVGVGDRLSAVLLLAANADADRASR